MVDHELEHLLEDFEQRLAQQGLDLDTYLKINQQSEDELKAELRESAESRLRRSLVLFELAKEEDIQVPENEVQTETISTLDTLSRSMPQDELKKLTSRDQIQNLVSNIMADMLVRKTIEHIRAISSDNKSLEVRQEEFEEAEPEADSEIASEADLETIIPGVETPEDEETLQEEVVEAPIVQTDDEQANLESQDTDQELETDTVAKLEVEQEVEQEFEPDNS